MCIHAGMLNASISICLIVVNGLMFKLVIGPFSTGLFILFVLLTHLMWHSR